MKLNARLQGARILAPVLKDRAFLATVAARTAKLGADVERLANEATGGRPAFRLRNTANGGLALEPTDPAQARRTEYGTLNGAPRPWAARLIAALRAFRRQQRL